LILQAEALERHYRTHGETVRALDGVSLGLAEREVVAVTGPSGSGKSTLLNVLGGLEQPSGGRLLFRGQDIGGLAPRDLAAYRRRQVGMVFQAFNLVRRMTALENVMLPMMLDGLPLPQRRERAIGLLGAVGLGERHAHRPSELSGGEQQRVSIARALANGPALILADEPTGNLDSARSAEILDLLISLNREQGICLVLVTHDESVAARADRRIALRDGKLAV
jgi:putative ABC transport system ATP-binding protein